MLLVGDTRAEDTTMKQREALGGVLGTCTEAVGMEEGAGFHREYTVVGCGAWGGGGGQV